jgi:hypothetical protein
MQMTVVSVPADLIVDWDTFHTVFEAKLGFPGYYGRNMDAWIDCLTYADDEDAGMIAQPVARGGMLALRVDNIDEFEKRCPEQYRGLVECVAFVNYHRIEVGQEPVLALVMSGSYREAA